MTLDDISRLVSELERGSARSLEYSAAGSELRLRRTAVALAPARGFVTREAVGQPQHSAAIVAPACGLFCRAHPLSSSRDELPRVIARGDLVAYLRIGSLISGVRAPADGTLISQLVEDGAVVGHATPLFEFVTTR